MRMSDTTTEETMVSEASNAVSTPKDVAAKSETVEQGQSDREKHNSNHSRDAQPAKSSKSNAKQKLMRGLAVCEESPPAFTTEPPAAPQDGFRLKMCQLPEKEELSVEDQGERESSSNKVEQKPEKTQRKMLSRDSSQDYTDSTSIDLHEFLVNKLKNNPRDRIMLLKLEQDILDFISNKESQKRKFPPMTSYHRMLLHRVAAYFGMDHNVDPSGKSVVINKTTNTRIPHQKFCEHIQDDRADDIQKRYILKRDNSSFDREDSAVHMRLTGDKRSKSMEDREDEYQQARDRGDHVTLSERVQEKEERMSTQQRRQMFRLRAGRSSGSRQSSSEAEVLWRCGEPRPWSSTDSSDSLNRPPPRPPITKASSFNGTPVGFVQGDSSASSSKSTAFSKTGSECSSSVGSSSSSLSRPQLFLPGPAPSRANAIPSTPVSQSDASGRCPGRAQGDKSGPSQQPPTPTTTNFYVLPLEATGIPPGSVLVSPHTGQPFPGSDGSSALYNPATPALPTVKSPQQGQASQQAAAPAAQQQPANHIHSQPDSLNTQFSHMTLAPQLPGDGGAQAVDPNHCPPMYHHHHYPSSMVLQATPLQQVAGYIVAGPSGGPPGQQVPAQAPVPTYPGASLGAGIFPGQNLSQSLLQTPAYIQPPVQQVASCYCAPSHYHNCSSQQHHYRTPVTPLPYNCPQGHNLPQQQVYQAAMSNPAPGYQTIVGVQPNPSPALASQQSNIGSQMQGLMVQYPPMASYQVPVPQGSQLVPHQSYQHPVVVPCQPGQGAVAVAGMQPYYGLLPPSQHATMSSTVSFLPAPLVEHLQCSQASSCVSHLPSGQQCTGVLEPPSANGMVMMQLTVPPGQQPRPNSPGQRKQPSHKHPSLGPQRSHRPTVTRMPPDNSQNRVYIASSASFPTQPPSSGHPGSLKGFPSSMSPIPIMAHHYKQFPAAFCPGGQGEAHYSLLGQALHYQPSIRPPLLHTAHMVASQQAPLGVWHSGQGRKAIRKALSADLSVGEPVSGRVLEVTDLPEGISCSEALGLLGELCNGGAIIKWLTEQPARWCSPAASGVHAGSHRPPKDLASSYTILAMFPSKYAAQSALLRHGGNLATFKLRTSDRHKEKLCDPGKASLL
ncbi:R3H domain-containing protein 1-like isoform X2 [Lampris incognitus]|uniref:R3H domain-containing protein 1-like isoform X2 n=1 Tax=Lampris incognitus TaxID=2546036 RepID=UPI0024B5938D|nr:R3H domain-containing protein 1-like isoform X2 [Lampris incognitus]